MRLFYARKKHRVACYRCAATLSLGEIYVRTGYKNKQLRWHFLFYHPDCFVDMTRERVAKAVEEFALGHTPPRRGGRPRKYVDIKEAHRLMCLVTYHRSKGHDEEVAKLKDRLTALRRENAPV